MHFETFEPLSALPVIHAFTGRAPGIDVSTDRETALARLEEAHIDFRNRLGLGTRRYLIAEQVHGAGIAAVHAGSENRSPAVDALVTDDPSVALGIYVADCGPVFIVDPVRRAIGCVHSGKKGTQFGIAAATVAEMVARYGCDPSQMTAVLGPCIRPPHYEIDFAADIVCQLRESVTDCGTCTAANPARYYSYRRELGKTGRMVALLALQ
jgi:copper oxidase (laccase) domain-containing protein